MPADRAALSEYAYLLTPDQAPINLAPWLQGPAICDAPRPALVTDRPFDPDLLDRLAHAHPRARLAPPWRTVTLRLDRWSAEHQRSPVGAMLAEIVVFLPDGYFVGFIVSGEFGDRDEITALEAVPALARWQRYPTPMIAPSRTPPPDAGPR